MHSVRVFAAAVLAASAAARFGTDPVSAFKMDQQRTYEQMGKELCSNECDETKDQDCLPCFYQQSDPARLEYELPFSQAPFCERFSEACAGANPLRVKPETRFLVDGAGRTTLLHGVNVIYKVDPYIPTQGEFDPDNSLNDEDIANLVDWGMNFVRLGVMWEAVETAPGVFNQTYLDQVDALITTLGENGMYTLIDGH